MPPEALEPCIGYDLDGSLSVSLEDYSDPTLIGDPIPKGIARVKRLLQAGYRVVIFTARMADKENAERIAQAIGDWTEKHVGQRLEATCEKVPGMLRIVDDKARGVVEDTGEMLEKVAFLPFYGEEDEDAAYEGFQRYMDPSEEDWKKLRTLQKTLKWPATLYRAVDDGGHLRTDRLGVHWTWDEKSAFAYFGSSRATPTILRARVPYDAVDWVSTIGNNAENRWMEKEITLKERASVELTGTRFGYSGAWETPEVRHMRASVTAKVASAVYPVTDEWIARAKEFLWEKWRERAQELGRPEPTDLNTACKFASAFAQGLFGGNLQGNYDHQYLITADGTKVDLTDNTSAPQRHDRRFWNNREHRESMDSVKPRVEGWLTEFRARYSQDKIAITSDKTAAQRGIYFHGSSIKNLRSILAQGLVPDAKEKNFGSEGDKNNWSHSIETYGGVYVTQNLMVALGAPKDRHEEGRELVVCMELQPNTFFVDEDAITGVLSHPLGRLSNHTWSILCAYVAAVQQASKWQEYIDECKAEFETTALQRYESDIRERDMEAHPQLLARVKEQLDAIWLPSLARLAAREIYGHGQPNEYEARRAWSQVMGSDKYYQFPGLEQLFPTREKAEAEFRSLVEKMTRTLGMLARPDADGEQHYAQHARITQPIGYRGSNRIVAVLEVRDSAKYRGRDYATPTPIIVHYGKVPPGFAEKWRVAKGSKYQIMTPEEDGEDVPVAKAASAGPLEGIELEHVKTASPDFGYSQYNEAEEDLGQLKWSTRPFRTLGFQIIATFPNGKGTSYEAGKIQCDYYPEGDGSPEGAVYSSIVEIGEEWRGTGLGQMLYDRAIAHARELGARWFRSDTSMTKDATRAWQRLKKRYPVKEVPYYAYDPEDYGEGESKPGYEIDLSKLPATKTASPVSDFGQSYMQLAGDTLLDEVTIGDYEFFLIQNGLVDNLYQIGMQRIGLDAFNPMQQVQKQPNDRGKGSLEEMKQLISRWLHQYKELVIASHDARKTQEYIRLAHRLGFSVGSRSIFGMRFPCLYLTTTDATTT